jgi:hypothetical protein
MSHVQVAPAAKSPQANLGRVAAGVAALFVVGLPIALWPVLGADVPLGSCGLGVLRYDDRKWNVLPTDAFTQADAPRWWRGHGFVTDVEGDRLSYRDFSGTRLIFTPGAANPTGC